MAQATLTKLCSFTQAIAGCNVADPDNPVPVLLIVMIDAAGNVIPPSSTTYPVGQSNFTGDESGFIRSYYTDMTMAPIRGTVEFSTSCCPPGTTGSTQNNLLVHRTISLLGGKLILRFGDADATNNPTVTLSAGKLSIEWADTQTPQSARFSGVPGDLSGNEFVIESVGGKDIANHSHSDADGFWPFIQYQNRNRLNPQTAFEQRPEDANDSLNIFNEPITTPGTVATKLTGISGNFGIFAQW